MYKLIGKRALDLVLSFLLIIVLIPVLVVVTIMLIVSFRGSPFFHQDRPGKDEKIFQLIKFRSMLNLTAEGGQLLDDEHRITRVGKFIRRTSLDELPSLFNVLKGDMSLVGPRPLLVEYLPLYSLEQARRHEVKPGITGWAQINGRNLLSWEEKFELDKWYVDNQSFVLDIKILLLTLIKVAKREGVAANHSETMPIFKG